MKDIHVFRFSEKLQNFPNLIKNTNQKEYQGLREFKKIIGVLVAVDFPDNIRQMAYERDYIVGYPSGKRYTLTSRDSL